MGAFEVWLDYLFNRPPRDLRRTPWYHRLGDPPHEWELRYRRWADNPAVLAEQIRRLFTDAGTLLRPYSDEQVGHGLKVIVDPSCGGHISTITDGRVPIPLQIAALNSIVTLFADVFAPRLRTRPSAAARGTQAAPEQSELSYICFMFWDVAPIRGDRRARETVLDVLEQTLALASPPCQQAALHGLGHEYRRAPDRVRPIIDTWLGRHRYLPEDLRDYACLARTGCVQ